MAVVEAAFRAATSNESVLARGGSIWRYSLCPFHLINKISGIGQMLYYRDNFLNVKPPHLLRFTHFVSLKMGITPERAFLQDLPCLGGSHHFIVGEPKVLEAFFAPHRNDDLFELHNGMFLIKSILEQSFPGLSFSDEDFIFSCSKVKSSFFRSLIIEKMRSAEYAPLIEQEVEKTLDHFAAIEGPINISHESRLLASSVVLKLIFNQNVRLKELCESVRTVSRYIIKKLLRKQTEADERSLKDAQEVFRTTALAMMDDPLFPEFEGMSREQKLAFMFAIFFAGQETTSTLLAYTVYTLGRNPQQQQNLREDLGLAKVSDAVMRSLQAFPPIYQVTRQLRQDVCLEFRLDGEEECRKIVFPKGDFLIADIWKSSRQSGGKKFFPFGDGAHECPGQYLAKREIKTFITRLVERYEFRVENTRELGLDPSIITELDEDVLISVKPAQKAAFCGTDKAPLS